MIEQNIPIFKRGSVLKQEMLEGIKDYVLDYSTLKVTDYSDGILRGCKITTTETTIYIGAGIILIDNIPFFLKEEVSIRCSEDNEIKILVARLIDVVYCDGCNKRQIDFIVISPTEKQEKDIELCRFRLQRNARLRSNYRNFEDMNTDYDTVCLTHAQWAGYLGKTVSYEILHMFAHEVLKTGKAAQDDKTFISEIFASNGESLSKETISLYISMKNAKLYEEIKYDDMYGELYRIYNKIKLGRAEMEGRPMRDRRILVD